MLEREISARCVLSYALWSVCLIVWAISWALGSDDLGRLGLIVCGAAVTGSVKWMFIQQREHFKSVAAVTGSVRSLQPK